MFAAEVGLEMSEIYPCREEGNVKGQSPAQSLRVPLKLNHRVRSLSTRYNAYQEVLPSKSTHLVIFVVHISSGYGFSRVV